MLYKDKEVFINPYYEKEVEVYRVSYTRSGRDEDGIYGSYDLTEEFATEEKAKKFEANLKERDLTCSFGYSYSGICIDGPIKKTKNVYLSKEDKVQCMIQFLTENGYKVIKEE